MSSVFTLNTFDYIFPGNDELVKVKLVPVSSGFHTDARAHLGELSSTDYMLVKDY